MTPPNSRSRPGGLLLLLPSLIVAAACATPGKMVCPGKGGTPWVEAKSPHFVLRTNLSVGSARETVAQLERSRRALTLAFERGFDPPGVIEVFVLRDPGQLAEFFGQRPYVGMAIPRPSDLLLVMGGTGSFLLADQPPLSELQLHELTHYLSAFVLLRQPRWLAEGLAMYLQTLTVTADGKAVRLGAADQNAFARIVTRGRLDLARLWAWDGNPALSTEELQSHYASAWLWVHYLINRHTERFSRFQSALARAEEPSAGWLEAFGDLPPQELSGGLDRYLSEGEYTMLELPLEQQQPAVTVRAMRDSEVHLVRAELMAIFHGADSPEVMAEVEEADRLDPTGLTTVELPVYSAVEDELQRVRRVLATHPEHPAPWRALSAQLGGWKAGPPEQTEAELRRALSLNPERPDVLNALAWFLVTHDRGAEAVPYARRGAELAPWSAPILDTLAAALLQARRCGEARVAARRALERVGEHASTKQRAARERRVAEVERVCAQAK